jgi:hypothetical protein
LVTVPDIRHLPEFDGPLRAGRLSAAVANAFTVAIGRYNAPIRSLAANDSRIALIDLDLITRAATLLSRDYVPVAGRRLDRRRPANDLDCLFLADGRHPGTLGQGLMACLFIQVINKRFAAGIRPLEPLEVLALARSVGPIKEAGVGVVRPVVAPSPAPPPQPGPGSHGEGSDPCGAPWNMVCPSGLTVPGKGTPKEARGASHRRPNPT